MTPQQIASKKWYHKNRQRSMANTIAWRKKNPEKAKKLYRKSYRKNSESIKAKRKANYQKNRQKAIDHQMDYYWRNRERILKQRAARWALLPKKPKRTRMSEEKKRESLRAAGRRYYHKNRQANMANAIAWRKRNPERARVLDRVANERLRQDPVRLQRHRDYMAKYLRDRCRIDSEFALDRRLRARIRVALKKGYKQTSAVELTGCSMKHLVKHLLKGFPPRSSLLQLLKTHEIHHIKPCYLFDLRQVSEQLACFHWSNLMLMERNEHRWISALQARERHATKRARTGGGRIGEGNPAAQV